MNVIEKFVYPTKRVPAVLYCPEKITDCAKIAVLVMHSDESYLRFPTGPELAKRGFYCMNANMPSKEGFYWTQPEKMLTIRTCIKYLRSIETVEKVLIMGHSGGASTMSAYQAIAENGCEVFQGPEKIVPHPNIGKLIPADGVLLLDPNWGNAFCQLNSLDASILDENSGKKRDPKLDLYRKENGYNPDGFDYTEEFLTSYTKAQGERNNRLVDHALERYRAIENGEGLYDDDEPLTIPGAAQGFFNNKLFVTDTRLCHTHAEHKVIHGDGSITKEKAKTLNRLRITKDYTSSLHEGGRIFTVKNYLTSYAVRTKGDFGYNEDSVWGVDWDSTYNSAVPNVEHFSCPILITGMTAGVDVVAIETIYDHAASKDKDIVYVEGADHMFFTATVFEKTPGEFGDTMKLHHDYVAKWLMEPGRFI